MKKNQEIYAGFSKRLLAHNIDLIPILAILYLFSFLVPRSSFDPLFIGAIYLLYNILFELTWNATPGKKWVKISITNSDGKPPKFHQSLVRNISKIFSLVLLFGGFILISFDRKKRGLHDIIGGTLVLFNED